MDDPEHLVSPVSSLFDSTIIKKKTKCFGI